MVIANNIDTTNDDTNYLEVVESFDAQPIDLLNRGSFVEQMVYITNILAEKGKNICFALNGQWGSGKSFVLDLYERQLETIQSSGDDSQKYAVFHYNCWEYDYYDEPLIAIVAAMLDTIDEKEHLIPEEIVISVRNTLKVVGNVFINVGNKWIEDKTGINTKEFISATKDVEKGIKEDIKEDHSYDGFYAFRKTLKKLRGAIKEIAERKTVIIVVDELDRCLPEYTIRVLERLHHVFYGVANVQVILSVDKEQLSYTIKKIYGEKVSEKEYLAKFIDFEMRLSRGKAKDYFPKLFPDYYNDFSNSIFTDDEIVTQCNFMLEDIGMRAFNAILEKSQLCHRLLSSQGERRNRVYLCVEIFLSLLKHFDIKTSEAKEVFNVDNLFCQNDLFKNRKGTLTGLVNLSREYKKHPEGITNRCYSTNHSGRYIVYTGNVPGILLGVYRIILGFTNDFWDATPMPDKEIKDYVHQYWRFIRTIN